MKSVSDMLFAALTSSPEPMKQIEALQEVNKKIVSEFFSVSTGMSCQIMGESHATHSLSGSKADE